VTRTFLAKRSSLWTTSTSNLWARASNIVSWNKGRFATSSVAIRQGVVPAYMCDTNLLLR
jgi:hypothetical protein